MIKPRALAAAALLALLAPLAGCEENLTQANFDQITPGMTLEKVQDILGGEGTLDETSGTSISSYGVMGGSPTTGKMKTYVWKEGKKQIIVTFADHKVVSKQPINISE